MTAAVAEDVIIGVCEVCVPAPATVDEDVAPEPWKGGPAMLVAEICGPPLPDDAELPTPPVTEAEELVLVRVGAAVGPVTAPDAVPSEGVGLHVADRLLVKLIKPSDESGSDASAGNVPT